MISTLFSLLMTQMSGQLTPFQDVKVLERISLLLISYFWNSNLNTILESFLKKYCKLKKKYSEKNLSLAKTTGKNFKRKSANFVYLRQAKEVFTVLLKNLGVLDFYPTEKPFQIWLKKKN